MHVQAVFAELLGACRNNGMGLPPSNLINPAYGLPEQLVVYSDPRNQYVGQTLEQAYEAAVNYFKKVPDILFVILPERGEHPLPWQTMCYPHTELYCKQPYMIDTLALEPPTWAASRSRPTGWLDTAAASQLQITLIVLPEGVRWTQSADLKGLTCTGSAEKLP